MILSLSLLYRQWEIFCCATIVVLTVVVMPLYASELPRYYCTRLTEEQGLADNMVYSVLEDVHGFMWFGTRYGLNRYDGNHFALYRFTSGDSASPSSITFETFCEGRDGTLWVGTDHGGLDRLDHITGKFIHYYHGSGKTMTVYTTSIGTDKKGNVWYTIAGVEWALKRLDTRTGVITCYHHDPNDPGSISSDEVFQVCVDSSGNVWVSTANGLNRYNEQKDNFVNYGANLAKDFTMASRTLLYTSPDGTLWCGGESDHIYALYYKKNTLQVRTYSLPAKEPSVDNIIFAIYVDNTGSIWVGTSHRGMYILDTATGRSRQYTYNPADPFSFPGNRVSGIIEDHSGNIWVATNGGVAKFHHRDRYVSHILYNTGSLGLSFPEVRYLLKEGDGTLWIGTGGGGLDKRNAQGIYTHFSPEAPHREEPYENTVNVLLRTRRGILLLGTNDGLFRLDSVRGEYRAIDIGLRLHQRRIWALHEDRHGDIWVGLLKGGVLRLDPHYHLIRTYFAGDSNVALHQSYGIFCIHGSRNGSILFGGSNGLYRIDAQTRDSEYYYKHLGDSLQSLSFNHVWNLCETHDGTIWIGTSGGGITVLDPKTGNCRRFTEEQGLPNNVVTGVLEDLHGNIWVSTIRGLAKYIQAENRFYRFTPDDGIHITEFHFKSCCRDSNGFLYFGGTGGFISFHPDSIQLNAPAPKVVITSFRILDKDLQSDTVIEMKRCIVLDYRSNFFSIGFAALALINPKANHYQYMLEGVDEQWRETDGRLPSATYSSVAPGTYTFLLRGANSDGIWNNDTTRLTIVITPAWWQTLVFRLFIVLGIIASIVAVILWRVRERHRRMKAEKHIAEFRLQAIRARMNPHFIFNALNSILGFILASNTQKAHHYLSKFSRLVRAILEHSGVEYVSLKEELQILNWYLELESIRFGDKLSYQIEVASEVDTDTNVPSMLLQPLVENSIKHGLVHTIPNGNITIGFYRDGQSIVCTITDNGVGRAVSHTLQQAGGLSHTSRGLSLVRERMEMLQTLHGEDYSVSIRDASPEANPVGTHVELRFPAR